MVVCIMCVAYSYFPLSVHAVLPDLQQTNLFTSEEMKDIHGFADVVRIQRSKTPEILVKTVEVLERYGFEKEFRDVLGRQTNTLTVCLYMLCFSMVHFVLVCTSCV